MGTVQVRSKPIVPAQAALILAIAAAGTLLAAPTPVSAASAISQPRGPISWDSNSDDQLGIGAACNQQDPRAIAPPCAGHHRAVSRSAQKKAATHVPDPGLSLPAQDRRRESPARYPPSADVKPPHTGF